jgi:hypothetical protein
MSTDHTSYSSGLFVLERRLIFTAIGPVGARIRGTA